MPRPGSTTARGYGAAHQALRKRAAHAVNAGRAACWRCGDPIDPHEPWDLGHDDHDRSLYRGPEHRACNRGGRPRTAKPSARLAYDANDPRVDPNEPPITPGDPRPLVRGARWQRTPESPIYIVGDYCRQWTRDHPPMITGEAT